MDDTDSLVARAARQGDDATLQALIRRHYPAVLSFAWSALHHRPDAEDAAQDTFFKVVRSIGRFGLRCRFSTWLHRVARNTVADHLRRRRARAKLDQAGAGVSPRRTVGSATADPAPLEALLAPLPREERALLRSVYADGTPVPRLARRLGIPAGAVRWRLLRARKRLRAAVRPIGTGGPR